MSQITTLRMFEKIMLVLFVISILGAMWSLQNISLEWYEQYAVVGLLVLFFSLLLYIQNRVDQWIMVALEQTNFVQNDVFSSLYDRSPVPYLIINQNGGIAEYNGAAAKLFHTDITELRGQNFFGRVHPESPSEVTVLQGKVRAGLTITDIEIPLVVADEKEPVWVLMSVFAYRSSGERLIALVDVTEQKKIDTAKSEFVALATHQLRTPIAAIRWNVELLNKNLRDNKTEAQERYLTKIERNVFRMIDLINDFLSVSKLEMGTYATTREPVNLTEFLDSIIDEFSGKIAEKEIVVKKQLVPEDITFSTDQRLLHIIVSNLVSNAVKYLHQGGELVVLGELQNDKFVLEVADNGIGIPEGELGVLFTKFYRASNAQTHQTEGTGLGLYIVKQSVEQLGGTIAVDSAADQGARFVVSLPTT
jgi:PAS domain S-box-containing protein